MPSNEDLNRLKAMADAGLPEAEWSRFEQYLDLRAKGLRKAAMDALRLFLTDARRWTFKKRKRFTSWLSEQAVDFSDRGLLVPHELLNDVMAPTIREWLVSEPNSSLAYYLFR